jgi:hypothetical protein
VIFLHKKGFFLIFYFRGFFPTHQHTHKKKSAQKSAKSAQKSAKISTNSAQNQQ